MDEKMVGAVESVIKKLNALRTTLDENELRVLDALVFKDESELALHVMDNSLSAVVSGAASAKVTAVQSTDPALIQDDAADEVILHAAHGLIDEASDAAIAGSAIDEASDSAAVGSVADEAATEVSIHSMDDAVNAAADEAAKDAVIHAADEATRDAVIHAADEASIDEVSMHAMTSDSVIEAARTKDEAVNPSVDAAVSVDDIVADEANIDEVVLHQLDPAAVSAVNLRVSINPKDGKYILKLDG